MRIKYVLLYNEPHMSLYNRLKNSTLCLHSKDDMEISFYCINSCVLLSSTEFFIE